jgi:hypothetical protein
MKMNTQCKRAHGKKFDGANDVKNTTSELTYLSMEHWWEKWPQNEIFDGDKVLAQAYIFFKSGRITSHRGGYVCEMILGAKEPIDVETTKGKWDSDQWGIFYPSHGWREGVNT